MEKRQEIVLSSLKNLILLLQRAIFSNHKALDEDQMGEYAGILIGLFIGPTPQHRREVDLAAQLWTAI